MWADESALPAAPQTQVGGEAGGGLSRRWRRYRKLGAMVGSANGMILERDVGDRTVANRRAVRGAAVRVGAQDPEFRLAAACCRWPPSDGRNVAIRSAAAAITDWRRFLNVVERQRVAGLAHNALLSAEIALPAPIAQGLAAGAQRIVRHNLISGAETVRLYNLLGAAQIPVLVLKGAALAQLAYGALGAKHARDIDLLVPPDRAEAAMELLEREGYALAAPAQQLGAAQRRALIQYGREAEFAHRRSGLLVELQWRVADNPLLLQGVTALSSTQEVRLADGAVIRTLADADLFAALCVHGALHSWSRMKWLADLNAAIAASGVDIERLYRHAQSIGAGLCAGQALLLCRRLFDLPLPPELADELQNNPRIEKLAGIGLTAMTAARPGTDPERGIVTIARNVYAQFLLGQGWDYFVAQCRIVAVGPADVIRWPLPRPLHFLYPLVRLPLLLWRRGKAALGHNR
jgi:Uncharacterised nucleotidyltransferase